MDRRQGESRSQGSSQRGRMSTFWATADTCLDELENAKTADAVIDTLNKHFPPGESMDANASAFFPASGGDRQLMDSLFVAGWTLAWSQAPYFYVVRNGNGELLTYIEGDVYRGDRR